MVQVVNPSDAEIGRSIRTARALNHTVLAMSRTNDMVMHLGSALTGAAIEVHRLHRLFLLSREEGAKDPAAYARYAHSVLGQEPDHTGDMALVEREADAFEHRFLPIYRGLLMVDPG
jgi:hypothetical protein